MITVITGILWMYLSPSLASTFLIFACMGAGAVFMETRPGLTISFFIYAGFGIFGIGSGIRLVLPG